MIITKPTLPPPKASYLAVRRRATGLEPRSPTEEGTAAATDMTLNACYWILFLSTWLATLIAPIIIPCAASLLIGPLVIGGLQIGLVAARESLYHARDPQDGATSNVASHVEAPLSSEASPALVRRQTSRIRANMEIHVINVDRLCAALSRRTAGEVLAELASSSRIGKPCTLVDLVPAKSTAFALISYRQEAQSDDGATLDATSLASIAEAARSAGLDGIWLDAWCYFNCVENNSYDHERFINTLKAVTTHAGMVLWLARARRTSGCGSYQFRLWPTFEASVVAMRQLPVVSVGVGPSRSQRLLRRLGSAFIALPGLPLPVEIRELAMFNSAMFVMMLCVPWVAPLALLAFCHPPMLGQISPALGRQAQLARSAAAVLQVMMNRQRATPVVGDELSSELRSSMPWFAAYDRRDALHVLTVLDHMRGHEPNPDELAALSISLYLAASLHPSTGDATCGTQLRAWLPAAIANQLAGQRGVVHIQRLRQFRWTVQRGASWVLGSPEGWVRVPAPPPTGARAEWSLRGLQLVSTSRSEELVAVGSMISFFASWAVGGAGLLVCLATDGVHYGLARGIALLAYTWLGGFCVAVVGACYPLMVKFSCRLSAAPHHPDICFFVQPRGYSLVGLLVCALGGLAYFAIFVVLFGMVAAVEGWPALVATSVLARFEPPAVPEDRAPLVFALVAFTATIQGWWAAMGTAQAVHMWLRAGSEAGRHSRDELVDYEGM